MRFVSSSREARPRGGDDLFGKGSAAAGNASPAFATMGFAIEVTTDFAEELP